MGLKETQKEFVELTLDQKKRTKAFSKEQNEKGEYKSFNREEIETQAIALLYKRLKLTKRILPFTYSFLNSEFQNLFFSYAKTYKEPNGVNRHRIDAINFARYIEHSENKNKLPKFIGDILKFETTPCKMWIEKRKLKFIFHYYNPRRLMRNTKPKLIIPIPTLIVWYESSRKQKGYHWREFSIWI